jgi:murein DD-endopeptidase MepM/ murein hydrolase activator NlpD
VVGVALALTWLAPPARAECLVGKLLCKREQTPPPAPSPTPTPSPSPSSGGGPASPSPRARPSSPPPARSRGPAPTPLARLRSAVRYVLDIAGTARSTRRLLDLLAQLKPPGQPLTAQDLVAGFGRFPVVGYVWYHDDWGAPRYTPYFHLHEGIDLFAVSGTPVIACADGVVAKTANGSIGGISLWLAGDDGITYYYGHLLGYAPGVAAGMRVRVGDVLGYVGDTGDAKGTYPHLHFEMHPGGGPPVNPKPVLDAWLGAAEASAANAYQRLVERTALVRIGAARWQRIFDLLREPAAPVVPLWTALDVAGRFGMEVALDAVGWSLDPSVAGATAASGGLGSSLPGLPWPSDGMLPGAGAPVAALPRLSGSS